MGLSFLYLAAPMVHGTMALFDWVSVGVEFDLGTEHPAMHPENVRRHIRRRCSRQRSGLRFRWRRFRLGLRVDGASVKIVQQAPQMAQHVIDIGERIICHFGPQPSQEAATDELGRRSQFPPASR
jgi:hypothetical protein